MATILIALLELAIGSFALVILPLALIRITAV
jgi:hypothetical protein